jgi:hypothetical protein
MNGFLLPHSMHQVVYVWNSERVGTQPSYESQFADYCYLLRSVLAPDFSKQFDIHCHSQTLKCVLQLMEEKGKLDFQRKIKQKTNKTKTKQNKQNKTKQLIFETE